MLLALLIAPLASLLWGITNYIDKYLLSKITVNGDYKGLIVFSSLIAGLTLLPVSMYLTKLSVGIDIIAFIYILLSATAVIIATTCYFKALNKNDTTIVIAMFQLIPVFSYFLGITFLNEVLTLKQILGGIIVILSSIAITFEYQDKKFDKGKLSALLLMSLSSLSFAVYFFLFRLTTIKYDFEVMTFWYQIALIINGLLIVIFLKKYRHSFINLVTSNGKKVFGFNLLNEILNLIANIIMNFAITLAPMAIVLTLNGLQPFFVFITGLLLTLFLPKIFKEDIRVHSLIYKFICIIFSIIGIAILYL